jgi:hypothetical protein
MIRSFLFKQSLILLILLLCTGLKVQAVANGIPDVELERQLKNSLYENAESRAKKRLSAKLNLSAN